MPVHPTALIDPRAQIDPGVEIGAYAIIEGRAQIAAGCRVGSHAQIIGDVRIGAGSTIGRGAIIGDHPQDLSFDPAMESGVIIGEKNTIREHVTIHRSNKPGGHTRIGDGNFIMVGAHLAHDVFVGDRNVIANNALLAGHVHVGSNSFLGGGSVFHQFLRVGDFCMTQGNSAMSADVPHYCSVNKLNRLAGLNVIGMKRAGFTTADRGAVKEMFNLLFRSGKNLAQACATAREKTWPPHAEKLLQFIEARGKRGICTLSSWNADDSSAPA